MVFRSVYHCLVQMMHLRRFRVPLFGVILMVGQKVLLQEGLPTRHAAVGFPSAV